MARHPIIVLALGVLAAAGASERVDAQVSGVVVDTGAEPVAGAIVEVWSGARILAQTVTGADGRFSLPASAPQGAAAITARRVGFQPVRRELGGEVTHDVHLVMVQAANRLPELVVESGGGCPNREDPGARALWNGLPTRYRQAYDVEVAGTGVRFAGAVTAENLGAPAATDPLRVFVGSTGFERVRTRDRIEQEGYARRFSGGEILGERQFWDYVSLDLVHPQHFTDPLFARLHSFSIHHSDSARTVIQFCPVNPRRPHITGTLTIDGSGSLIEATWSFGTSRTVELAGGRVTFAPFQSDRPVLLPQTVVYWRTTVNGDFFQRWDEFAEWRIETSGDRR